MGFDTNATGWGWPIVLKCRSMIIVSVWKIGRPKFFRKKELKKFKNILIFCYLFGQQIIIIMICRKRKLFRWICMKKSCTLVCYNSLSLYNNCLNACSFFSKNSRFLTLSFCASAVFMYCLHEISAFFGPKSMKKICKTVLRHR